MRVPTVVKDLAFKGTCLMVGLVLGVMLGGCKNDPSKRPDMEFTCKLAGEVTEVWSPENNALYSEGAWILYGSTLTTDDDVTYTPRPGEACGLRPVQGEGSP